MKLTRTATAGLLATAVLTACNTPETSMVPPMEIGDGGQAVSDNDLSLARGPQTSYAQSSPVQSAPLGEQGYYPSAPQNTLEAQAAALESGQNPVASAPLDGALVGGAPPSSLAAEQPRMTAQAPVQTEETLGTQPAPTAQVAETRQVAALPPAASGTLRFLPIIGAPVQSITPLSRQLGAEARAKGLTIKGSGDPSSEHILKGYLSAFGDGSAITVVYVWDVLDATGNRLHRIQGEEKVPSAASDPWAGVPASLMQQIGTKTIAEYMSWRQAHGA